MRRKKERINTVCFCHKNEKKVPIISLVGNWLKEAGFDGGVKFKIFSCKGIILLVDTGKRAGQE